MHKITLRLEQGFGRREDLDILTEVTGNLGMMPGMSICGLSDGAAFAIKTIMQKFRGELEGYIADEDAEAVKIALEVMN